MSYVYMYGTETSFQDWFKKTKQYKIINNTAYCIVVGQSRAKNQTVN